METDYYLLGNTIGRTILPYLIIAFGLWLGYRSHKKRNKDKKNTKIKIEWV